MRSEDQSVYEVIFFHDRVGEFKNTESDNSKAIMVMPKVVHVNPIQVVGSFMILFHNLKGEDTFCTQNNQAVGVPKLDISYDLHDYIAMEADVSPKLLKNSRKGKKQGNADNSQPTRVQLKRTKSFTNK